jgi:hypothetical protein
MVDNFLGFLLLPERTILSRREACARAQEAMQRHT